MDDAHNDGDEPMRVHCLFDVDLCDGKYTAYVREASDIEAAGFTAVREEDAESAPVSVFCVWRIWRGKREASLSSFAVWRLAVGLCRTTRETWKLGLVHVGTGTEESAAYVAGYVVKRLNKSSNLLCGRAPEFSVMSRKPMLGFGALHEIASSLLRHNQVDVPGYLVINRKKWPLGQTAKRRLRKLMGRDEKTPLEVTQARYLNGLDETNRLLALSVNQFSAEKEKEKSQQMGSLNRNDNLNREFKRRRKL
jgi:hypothetical protein